MFCQINVFVSSFERFLNRLEHTALVRPINCFFFLSLMLRFPVSLDTLFAFSFPAHAEVEFSLPFASEMRRKKKKNPVCFVFQTCFSSLWPKSPVGRIGFQNTSDLSGCSFANSAFDELLSQSCRPPLALVTITF